jgi:hypothetical protein
LNAFIPHLDPETYKPHWLHDALRNWPETNCYVDVWIEVLSALGHDPCAAAGFTVTQDFEGDQFTFFKYPAEDLELIYGIGVQELAIFERVDLHAAEQVRRGRLPLVEVDSYYLPDTKGVSYRLEHTKSTIGINRIDASRGVLDYFHNGGYYRLSGEDFDRIFPRPSATANAEVPPGVLFPYVEFVKVGARPTAAQLPAIAMDRLRYHLKRRPTHNPFTAFQGQLDSDLDKLIRGEGPDFQKYAFNTARQFGANFDLLAAHLNWLASAGTVLSETAAAAAARISDTAKAFQFQLARAIAKKQSKGVHAGVERMIEDYRTLMDALDVAVGEK